MIRLSTLLWTALAGAVGFGLFQLKHQVQSLEDEIFRLNRSVVAEQQAIHVLKAEWSYINQPQRLQSLAARHLDLQPMKPAQFGTFADLPMRGESTSVASAPAKSPQSTGKKVVVVKPIPQAAPRAVAASAGPVLTNHSGSRERR